MKPAYSFTIPSIEDDTVLDCRLYHSEESEASTIGSDHISKGAVIAHPYASLGGSQDDAVVLSVTECLVNQGYVVGTFNFRGAGESQGKTSSTGKGEKDDYISFAGFMVYYLQSLVSDTYEQHSSTSTILLAGYSYGSLILSHLPSMTTILDTFEGAEAGTSAAEVILRARRLGRDTSEARRGAASTETARGRQKLSDGSRPSSGSKPRANALTVTMGGEETDASTRRLSRDSREGRRSHDVIRRTAEVPHRIKAVIRRRSSSRSQESPTVKLPTAAASDSATSVRSVRVRYLLISPLLPPLAHALVPPHSLNSLFGRRHDHKPSDSGFGSLKCPSLVAWGTHDTFTSHKRLQQWAQKLRDSSQGLLSFLEVKDAGHFWREQDTMQTLLSRITDWAHLDEAKDTTSTFKS